MGNENPEVTTSIADVMRIGKPEKGRWYKVEYQRSDGETEALFAIASTSAGAYRKCVDWLAALAFTSDPAAMTTEDVWAEYQKIISNSEKKD